MDITLDAWYNHILIQLINNQNNLGTICQDLTGSRLFIKRHNLTKKISDNVKAARAGVTRDIIKNYFSHLEKWVIVPRECIYNFDETNVMDDPGAKTVVCRRG